MVRSPGLPEATVEVGFRHGDRDRPYLLHTPRSVRAPAALLLQLHGRGIGPLDFDRWTGFSALADEERFVLAMPRAIDEIWNDGRYRERAAIDDVGYLLAVIDDAVRRSAIDQTGVYVVGMSNGASMAGRLAWEHPERISAVGQVAGTLAAAVASLPSPNGAVPVIQMHGTRDRSAPYAGGRAAFLMRLLMRPAASPALSVDAWAERWAERNAATDGPRVEAIGPDITRREWRGPSPDADIAFYRIVGGGHTWPGARVWMPPHLGHVSRTVDATRTIWEFLSAHRRAG